jgi:hypothetical protein
MGAIRMTSTERDQRIASAEAILLQFADRTGLSSSRPAKRYLWTDAFAVCGFLSLTRATGRTRYLELAKQLVDAVHRELGHHRADDRRSGWLSGLGEREGAKHPTAGGLRIGKTLPERRPDEPFDQQLEWDRDGQYFHYLTKWMHALDQVALQTGEARYNRWARELARVAHDAFRQPERGGLHWKMSIDLSHPLVPGTSPHDALDGFVTVLQLQRTAALLPDGPAQPDLEREKASLGAAIDVLALGTTDPLGLGGLLMDGCRIAQVEDGSTRRYGALLRGVLATAGEGIRRFDAGLEPRRPAESRLAFRELGLAIGLEGLGSLDASGDDGLQMLVERLERHLPLARAIEAFWSISTHQRTHGWLAHQDINEVMLATSLLPDGFLGSPSPGG